MICRFLAPAGYLVDETQNYDGLPPITGDQRYDLVLASFASLEPCFLDIVKQITKAGVPLLLMTGGVEQDAIAEAVSLGAYGPLLKPFDSKALVAMVRDILR
jgi:DNA-binding NtrC family response regulator